MDLDKYKKAWKNQPEEANKVSKTDIYKMAHSKSSSIVKWIFIIGLLEFVFVAILNLFIRITPRDHQHLNNPIFKNMIWFEILSYAIIIYFLIRFYKNYKNISTSDDTKMLMNKILKTRKTVKLYVFINLVIVFLTSSVGIFYSLNSKDYNSNASFIAIISISIILILFFLFLYWLFYQLLYGILLRKLNRNYKELAKLDELN